MLADRRQGEGGREHPTKISLRHLLTVLSSNQGFYVGADRLLRRVGKGHPDGGARSLARRSLVLHLAGLADASARLRFAAGADLVYWVNLLGEERVGQIRSLDPDRLNREAAALADQVATENREFRRSPNRDIEALRQRLGRTAVGSHAPEIEGTDLHRKSFALSPRDRRTPAYGPRGGKVALRLGSCSGAASMDGGVRARPF